MMVIMLMIYCIYDDDMMINKDYYKDLLLWGTATPSGSVVSTTHSSRYAIQGPQDGQCRTSSSGSSEDQMESFLWWMLGELEVQPPGMSCGY